jgi:tetratricopeptide (TPR) repeat protein
MTTAHTAFEIFLSYARKDNQPLPELYPQGWVTAIRDHILEDHRRFSTEPLRIFYDASDIRDMDDWQHRILGALRHSKILLVCLSPNYFASDYCRWEWEEYLRRQVHQLMGSDSIATLYFVEAPGTSGQDSARWAGSITHGNFTDIRPWFPEGAAALQREEVRKRMAKLGESLWERIRRARRATGVPGNLRRQNEYFVGRTEELRHLHENLATGAVGLVTAVHGLGGQGKTELAVAYAHSWADCYPAGLWVLGAEGKREILPLLGELAVDPQFGYRPADAERNDPVLLGRAVLAELQRRAEALRAKDPDAPAAALVLLDNVSEAGLLSPAQLASLPRADWLRLIATTRLGRDPLRASGKSLAFIAVDSLDEASALALIRDHQPSQRFTSPAEEASAREIVRELGGFTLAVEQVAVHLGLHPEIAPSAFLSGLRRKGLSSADNLGQRPDVQSLMLHQQKQLALILEATLSLLCDDAPALTALRFSALLPPDCVPWPWLKTLVAQRHPELACFEADEPDPWLATRRRLTGLRLLTDGDDPALARIHRLVAAHLQTMGGTDDSPVHLSYSTDLSSLLAARAQSICNTQSPPDFWELDALLLTLPPMLAKADVSRDVANAAVFFSEKVLTYRSLREAMSLLQPAQCFLKCTAESDPSNAGWQFDLSLCHQRIGNALLPQGDLIRAQQTYGEALAIMRCLTILHPGNADWQRELSVSLNNVGDVLRDLGDLAGALKAFRESLAVAERLAAADSSNAGWQHDLSVSLNNVGRVLRDQGDLAGALKAFRDSLAVRERLAAADPSNSGWQHDLSVSLNYIGGALLAQGDLEGTLKAFRASLAVRERLAAADPSNAVWQRDLSFSLNYVGSGLLAQGDLAGALIAFRESLAVRERLTAADPSNSVWLRDLSVSQDKIGNVLLTQGDLAGALKAFRESLAVAERLAAADPSNAVWQRDLSVSQKKIGLVLRDQGDLAGALDAFRESLTVAERLASADPSNAVWQSDLAGSLHNVGDVLHDQCDLEETLKAFRNALAVAERLASAAPSNARWQRDLSVSQEKIGDVLRAQGDLAGGLKAYRESMGVREHLALSDPSNAGWQRDLFVSYWKMADIAEKAGAGDALAWFGKAYDRLSDMKQRGIMRPTDEKHLAVLREKAGR